MLNTNDVVFEKTKAETQVWEEIMRLNRALLKQAENGINKTLSEILVCPLSKQPLRYCEETNSLISDAIGVAYPIKDGIPCLHPRDGKVLDNDDEAKPNSTAGSSTTNKE